MIATKQCLKMALVCIIVTTMMFYTNLNGLLSLQLNVRTIDKTQPHSDDRPINNNFLSYPESAEKRSSCDSSDIVIFNRVPKTGSTTLANLFYDAGQRNKFSVLLANFSKINALLSLEDQAHFVHNISSWTAIHPVLVHGHFPYLNFNRFGVNRSPAHFSVIRHPLDRLVSSYYYKRYGDTFHGDKRHSKYKDTTTFNDCVERNLSECSPDALWFQIPFFCGNYHFCSEKGSLEALKEAKLNARTKYLLIGVTEKLEQFIEIVEKLVPLKMSGIFSSYKNSGHIKLRKTKHKDDLSESTKLMMQNTSTFRMEIEFYNYVSSLFTKQYSRLRDRELLHKSNDFAFKYEKLRLVYK